MIKAVIFDMYGVIMEDPDGCLAVWIRERMPHLSEADIIDIWKKLNINQIDTMQFWTELGFTGNLKSLETEYLDSLVIDSGFIEIAKKLKDKYRLALLSNDASAWSLHLRSKFRLDSWFDAIVISGDYPVRKPDPAIYRILIGKLGLNPEECVFIDDRKKNLDAARNLGITPVLFRRPLLANTGYEGFEIKSFSEMEAVINQMECFHSN